MKQYVDLVKKILAEGEDRIDRTGVGTRAVFGGMLEFDLRERFPLVTVKETRWRTAFLEMLWFLRGEDSVDWLHENGSKLWDEWADECGYLGPIYGVQWRRWEGSKYLLADGLHSTDQIKTLIDGLKGNPTGRRHIVSAWNVTQLPEMALPPCHWAHQCYVSNDGHLDMVLYQRSWDVSLGAPFNIAQYALLLSLYGRATGLYPRYLKVSYGDAHIYKDHLEPMAMVAEREIIDCQPALVFNTQNRDIDGYGILDFNIVGYEYHPHVPLKVAV